MKPPDVCPICGEGPRDLTEDDYVAYLCGNEMQLDGRSWDPNPSWACLKISRLKEEISRRNIDELYREQSPAQSFLNALMSGKCTMESSATYSMPGECKSLEEL